MFQVVVLLLSTNSDPRTHGSVTRKTGKSNEEIEIVCPQSVINYTKHMGGVDVSDQKRECYGVGRSSKKMVEIYVTFCPKCESCKLFHII
jgi:NAD-dependent dihydropyrimidine dehydrogenase PreA subunit